MFYCWYINAKTYKKSISLENRNLFLFLASGVVNDVGFWLIGIKDSDKKILDDKTLLECHRKELIGEESAKDILNAININLDTLIRDLKKDNIPLDEPPIGVSFNVPLDLLEKIFDFWLEKYKDQQIWETCFGILKIRRRISLTNLINSNGIKGDSKKLALEIEDLHTFKPNSIKKQISNEPMWK